MNTTLDAFNRGFVKTALANGVDLLSAVMLLKQAWSVNNIGDALGAVKDNASNAVPAAVNPALIGLAGGATLGGLAAGKGNRIRGAVYGGLGGGAIGGAFGALNNTAQSHDTAKDIVNGTLTNQRHAVGESLHNLLSRPGNLDYSEFNKLKELQYGHPDGAPSVPQSSFWKSLVGMQPMNPYVKELNSYVNQGTVENVNTNGEESKSFVPNPEHAALDLPPALARALTVR